jgi:glycosyltransferase involved in cell wall biosynthesis
MLRRAVACFLAQTHAPCELVVVFGDDDPATRDYLLGLDEPSIRPVEVSAARRLSLGALRNISLDAARGRYVANWDDDDWHAPTRVAAQLRALHDHGRPASVLWRWTIYDEVGATAYLSAGRPWEGSLLAERGAMPRYPDLSRGEDSVVVKQLLGGKNLVALDNPELFIYVFHGANTWERAHWLKNILRHAEPLPPADQERVRALLQGHGDSAG